MQKNTIITSQIEVINHEFMSSSKLYRWSELKSKMELMGQYLVFNTFSIHGASYGFNDRRFCHLLLCSWPAINMQFYQEMTDTNT